MIIKLKPTITKIVLTIVVSAAIMWLLSVCGSVLICITFPCQQPCGDLSLVLQDVRYYVPVLYYLIYILVPIVVYLLVSLRKK